MSSHASGAHPPKDVKGARLAALLEHWRVPAGLLELEITETVAITHWDQASGMLEDIDALGVHLTLDDFGMGYSSLAHLQQLPVSRLKIDRQFIQGLPGDAQNVVLTRAIIGLARTLGKTLVAEGVETEAQCQFLVAEGCELMQGWLFARALPADAVPALVARHAMQVADGRLSPAWKAP